MTAAMFAPYATWACPDCGTRIPYEIREQHAKDGCDPATREAHQVSTAYLEMEPATLHARLAQWAADPGKALPDGVPVYELRTDGGVSWERRREFQAWLRDHGH